MGKQLRISNRMNLNPCHLIPFLGCKLLKTFRPIADVQKWGSLPPFSKIHGSAMDASPWCEFLRWYDISFPWKMFSIEHTRYTYRLTDSYTKVVTKHRNWPAVSHRLVSTQILHHCGFYWVTVYRQLRDASLSFVSFAAQAAVFSFRYASLQCNLLTIYHDDDL